jgi:hypothetical protein
MILTAASRPVRPPSQGTFLLLRVMASWQFVIRAGAHCVSRSTTVVYTTRKSSIAKNYKEMSFVPAIIASEVRTTC